MMPFNLKEKCEESKSKEFYYGAKINKQIKDVYFGIGYLEPDETKKKVGPGRNHEEILYIQEGQVQAEMKGETFILNEGELMFIPDGSKANLKNVSDKRCQFIIAGGHTKFHKH